MNGEQQSGAHFRIRVQAALDPGWSDWLDGMRIAADTCEGRAVTVLDGAVSDQAALRGILSRLWDLNLVVLSVERLTADTAQTTGNPAQRADPVKGGKGK
jgi:hypothetical protein